MINTQVMSATLFHYSPSNHFLIIVTVYHFLHSSLTSIPPFIQAIFSAN